MAPAGTPAPVIARLSAAMTEILRDPEVVEKFNLLGAEAVAMSPEDLRKYLASRGRDLDADRPQGEHQGGVTRASLELSAHARESGHPEDKHWVPAFAGTSGSA